MNSMDKISWRLQKIFAGAILVFCSLTAGRPHPMDLGLDIASPVSMFWPGVEPVLSVAVPEAPLNLSSVTRRQPILFEENVGQHHPEVRFLARGAGCPLFFTESEVVLVPADSASSPSGDLPVLRMRFAGARTRASVEGRELLQAKANYFIGSDPSRWRTNIPNYGRIRYAELYPGIYLVFYSNADGRLEYDYIVAPGASPALISMIIEGADRVEEDENGDLRLIVNGALLHWSKPKIFQEIDGLRVPISGKYRVEGTVSERGIREHRVFFQISAYNQVAALVIDPALLYSTYLGGRIGYGDNGTGIGLDQKGNAYICGTAQSLDFPTRNAFQNQLSNASGRVLPDVFVTKFDTSGNVVYSTYVGGDSVEESNVSIKVATDGSVVVAGSTRSNDFPTRNALQPFHADDGVVPDHERHDCFVFRLDSTGSALVFSTYFGGTAAELPRALALDRAGNIYVAGTTSSGDFPIKNAVQPAHAGPPGGPDAFLFKLSPAGEQLLFATYLGGGDGEGVSGIEVNPLGQVWVAGVTLSSDFPTTAGAYQPALNGSADGFLTLLSADGQLLDSTYFGGELTDRISAFTIGNTGDLYFEQQVLILGRPIERFITRYNPATRTVVYTKPFGPTYVSNLAVDKAENLYVAGYMGPNESLTLKDQIQEFAGGTDAFVSVVNPNFELLFSTFIGGTPSLPVLSGGDWASAIAVDNDGNIHVVGGTESANFPVVNAFQPELGGARDAFYLKFSPIGTLSKLNVSRADNALVLSWPATVTNAFVESSMTATAGSWTPLQAPPIQLGNEQVVTVDLDSSSKFYRLRRN